MEYTKDELALILLDSIMGLEHKNKSAVVSRLGSPSEAFSDKAKLKSALSSVLDEGKVKTVTAAFDDGYCKFLLEKYQKRSTVVLTYLSKDYPEEFRHVDFPPICVYCNGNLSLLNEPKKFSIVGSRKCPADTCAVAKDYSSSLSAAGACIVTGSAGGADSAALEGAVDSGRVICVIAGGINHVYPEYNKRLVEKVEQRGLVVSEQPPDAQSKFWMFPMRNRLIAGLGKGVLIVGGKRDSGARHTASFALDYGKEIFAFPYSLGVSMGELNNSLIKSGAALCDDVNDIFDFLCLEKKTDADNEVDEEEKKILTLIKDGVDDADEIMRALSLKPYELAPVLTELEVKGFIVRTVGNKYKTVR